MPEPIADPKLESPLPDNRDPHRIDSILEELDALDPDEKDPNPDNPDDEDEIPAVGDETPAPVVAADDTEDEEEEETPAPVSAPAPEGAAPAPTPTPAPEAPKVEPKPGDPDYKDLYLQSTKQALGINGDNKRYVEAVKKASELPLPTDEELKQHYPTIDLDMTDEATKISLKEGLRSRQGQEMINEAVLEVSLETEKLQKWNEGIRTFVSDNLTNFPYLKGNVEAFIDWALLPTRRNADFETLAKAFGADVKVEKKNKGSLLINSSGGGGREGAEKPEEKKGLDEKDAMYQRTTKPRTWMENIKTGKLTSAEILKDL